VTCTTPAASDRPGQVLAAASSIHWPPAAEIDGGGRGVEQGDHLVAAVDPDRTGQCSHDQHVTGSDLPGAGAAAPGGGSGLMMKSSGQTVSWSC
jgi:hypothetical protein